MDNNGEGEKKVFDHPKLVYIDTYTHTHTYINGGADF